MANMNTANNKYILDGSLHNVSKEFRTKIISSYIDLKKRACEAQYDAAGISAGKFCESVLRLLQEEVTCSHIPFGKAISNMADECRKLIASDSTSSIESIRIIIPRALVFLYTLRNKRGIGHIGGDVDANKIDLTAIVTTADWIICELIRIYHKLSLEEAQDIIDGLSFKSIPTIWKIAGKKRVLKPDLSAQEKTLLLLYSETDLAILVEDLCDWVEYSNLAVFKSNVLNILHKKKFIEYDRSNGVVYLSPLGAIYTDRHLL
jgi:hypothetical protein